MEPDQTTRGLPGQGKTVAVAMSGGVDSSVAAALLLKQGYQVVGLHMKLAPSDPVSPNTPRPKSCCSLDDSLDARQVCHRLGIPFYVLDFQEVFAQKVVQYFVESYRRGLTPNPCVMCNMEVKNRVLMAKAKEIGCDCLATGHYARVGQNPQTGVFEISRPRDHHKDQTYFLFGTPAEELPHMLFPLAETEKPQARKLAGELSFLNWNKPDSQEICFVPGDYRDFVRDRLGPQTPGEMVDTSGQVVGTHPGLAAYTIGQRRGLGVSAPNPLYVVALDPASNRVILGEEPWLYSDGMEVTGVNWVSVAPPVGPLEVMVKVRYAHQGVNAQVIPQPDGSCRVTFSEPVRAVAPGQAAVFYRGDVMLGGGWITQSFNTEIPAIPEPARSLPEAHPFRGRA
ncbi:MAG: tRNA 2-thiouridine(34) synthase MnmA [Deltaproteobacteria bacterium]|nr:tRNA 2-thiouridine(34) synthase MnmA [Deltaproteobacteria bacterium]